MNKMSFTQWKRNFLIQQNCLKWTSLPCSLFKFFLHNFIYLFILAVLGLHCCADFLQLWGAGAPHTSLQCVGFLLWWLLLLQSTGFRARTLQQLRHMRSVVAFPGFQSKVSIVVMQWFSCFMACEILPDQGSNQCVLQAGRVLISEPSAKPPCLVLNLRGKACSLHTMSKILTEN